MGASVRIVGCGRWAMGDDQAGLLVADALRRRNLPDAVVTLDEAPGGGLAEEALGDIELLIVVDAARADRCHLAGTFGRIDYRQRPSILAAGSKAGTHTLGVDAGLELADALGVLPAQVWIYVIFGEHFDRRLEVGETTAAGIEGLAERIERDVKDWIGTRLCTS